MASDPIQRKGAAGGRKSDAWEAETDCDRRIRWREPGGEWSKWYHPEDLGGVICLVTEVGRQLERENAELRTRAEAAEAQLQAEREHIAHLRAEAQLAEREREAAEVREAALRGSIESLCTTIESESSLWDRHGQARAIGLAIAGRLRRALAGEKGGA